MVKGASVGQGRLSMFFKSGKLDGQFQATGVQLSDFLGEDYLASIDLPDARLAGTLSQPVFTTSASAKDILLLGSQLDSANALVTLKNNIVQVDGIDIVAGGGGVEGFFSYDLTKKKGQANFTADKVGIADFVPKDLGTNVSGSFSGEAGISFDQEGFKLGSGEGKIAKVTVNETLIGDGDWKIRADGRTISGDAYLGGLGSSIDLTGMSYDLESKLIKGNVWVRHLEINDLSKIIKPYLNVSNPNLRSLMDRTNGQLGLSADLGGTFASPDIANGGLTLEALKVGEEKAGDLKASFARSNKSWTIDSLAWTGGPVALNAKGTVEESGAIDLEGSANGFDLRYLALYDVDLANWSGKVDVSLFTVQGLTKSPTIHASAASSTQTELGGISWGSAAPEMAKVFNFDLSNILISDGNEGLSVDGNINFRGYTASVAFKAPFAFPATIPTGSPIEGTLRLQQNIATLLDPRIEPNLGSRPTLFDPAKSSGMLTGLLRVSGTRDDLGISGDVELNAKKLGIRSGSQSFSDVFLKGSFLHDKVDLKFDAKSDFGGSLHGVANSDLPPLEQLLNADSFDEFLDSVVSGRLSADAFALKMKIGKDGQIAVTLGGELAFAGTIGKPSIKGNVDLGNTFLQMPSTLADSQDTAIPAYSPEFDITLRTLNLARFKSSSADIDMLGQGTIAGTFNDLDINALLKVQKGLLRLPTARVTLEQGGSIRPTFSLKDGVSNARLDVEIEGKTQVVAARFGQSAQRYGVTLDVKGDLLQDSGLVMVATSDPPELTQEEIFALLGQVQLIQGLAGGLQSGNAESQFREAFLGIAVPYLLDPFTSQIANAFKLDYLTLDINALDGATISFGKALGRNLMLSGSRQVSKINSAYPLKYDLRLSYRLRFGSRNDRQRLNFILGTDEFRPWKIGVEYGFRF
ncbi:MAG: hypothetical protein IT203_12785 [Fimbriimonadaceae bacterium]|nr:hypothetical protein [Fimbriimonadaceae bacterium]